MIIKSIFEGERGSKRDILILNAGAAIYIYGKAESIEQGIKIAEEIIDSGKALQKLQEYVNYSK